MQNSVLLRISLFLQRHAASILFTALLAGCSANAAPPPPALPQVTVAKAIQRTTDDFDEFTGRLQAVDVVEVKPRVAGLLQRVSFS